MSNGNGNGYHANGQAVASGLSDHSPPHNIEAEQGVLAGLLLDNSHFDAVLDVLVDADFYRDSHQVIFRAMVRMHQRGDPVEIIGLMEELTRHDQFTQVGGHEYFLELSSSIPHAANCPFHANIVRQKSITRQIIQASTETIREGYSQQFTAQQLHDRTMGRLGPITALAEEDEEIRLLPRPAPPAAAAWAGIAGELVRRMEEKTEADSAALLVQFLIMFGNVIGHKAHAIVNRSLHYTNLYGCVVGPSSVGRKGTGCDLIEWVLWHCDEEWATARRFGGIASGEGLIEKVRDEYCDLQGKLFPGEADKRAMWVESEFESVLAVSARDHSVVTPKLRQLWDRCEAASQSKNNPSKTTRAHVSIIGHCTEIALGDRLKTVEAANGFANRFLWCFSERTKLLPDGAEFTREEFASQIEKLQYICAGARGMGEVPFRRDREARELWYSKYQELSTPPPGVFGAMISRAAPQVLRLSMIYAVLDSCLEIRLPHLEAALAIWEYCKASAAYLFADTMGDPQGEKVLAYLAEGEPQTRRQIIRAVFAGRLSVAKMTQILEKLRRQGMIEEVSTEQSNGRMCQCWRLRNPTLELRRADTADTSQKNVGTPNRPAF